MTSSSAPAASRSRSRWPATVCGEPTNRVSTRSATSSRSASVQGSARPRPCGCRAPTARSRRPVGPLARDGVRLHALRAAVLTAQQGEDVVDLLGVGVYPSTTGAGDGTAGPDCAGRAAQAQVHSPGGRVRPPAPSSATARWISDTEVIAFLIGRTRRETHAASDEMRVAMNADTNRCGSAKSSLYEDVRPIQVPYNDRRMKGVWRVCLADQAPLRTPSVARRRPEGWDYGRQGSIRCGQRVWRVRFRARRPRAAPVRPSSRAT